MPIGPFQCKRRRITAKNFSNGGVIYRHGN
jgi:hypothetical protein